MFSLCLMTFANTSLIAYSTPLPIGQIITKALFWGILDVQQRVGKVSIKQNAPVDKVTILVTPNNGNEQPVIIEKGKTCNLKNKFPSATKCYIKITAPSSYINNRTETVIIDR